MSQEPTQQEGDAQEPDRDQILMMGHLDGELSPEEEAAFLERVRQDPHLAAELARYRNLQHITESIKLSEPTDLEWERFWKGFYNRLERQAGWLFVVLGCTLLVAYAAFEIIRSPSMGVLLKVGLFAVAVGFLLLFLNILRARLRLRRYDPYRGVRR